MTGHLHFSQINVLLRKLLLQILLFWGMSPALCCQTICLRGTMLFLSLRGTMLFLSLRIATYENILKLFDREHWLNFHLDLVLTCAVAVPASCTVETVGE